jgi:hypothetical protein
MQCIKSSGTLVCFHFPQSGNTLDVLEIKVKTTLFFEVSTPKNLYQGEAIYVDIDVWVQLFSRLLQAIMTNIYKCPDHMIVFHIDIIRSVNYEKGSL